jgi:hypothetical protein
MTCAKTWGVPCGCYEYTRRGPGSAATARAFGRHTPPGGHRPTTSFRSPSATEAQTPLSTLLRVPRDPGSHARAWLSCVRARKTPSAALYFLGHAFSNRARATLRARLQPPPLCASLKDLFATHLIRTRSSSSLVYPHLVVRVGPPVQGSTRLLLISALAQLPPPPPATRSPPPCYRPPPPCYRLPSPCYRPPPPCTVVH